MIRVTTRSKGWVCGHSLAGITGAWMSVSWGYCVLPSRGLCVEFITRPKECYPVWCVWVWSWSLDNEETLGHWGLLCHKKIKQDREHISARKVRDCCSGVLWVKSINNTLISTNTWQKKLLMLRTWPFFISLHFSRNCTLISNGCVIFRKFLNSTNYLFSRLFIDISVPESIFDVKLIPESWLIFEKVVSQNYKTRRKGICVCIGAMGFYRYIDSRNKNTELWGRTGYCSWRLRET